MFDMLSFTSERTITCWCEEESEELTRLSVKELRLLRFHSYDLMHLLSFLSLRQILFFLVRARLSVGFSFSGLDGGGLAQYVRTRTDGNERRTYDERLKEALTGLNDFFH